MRFGKRLLKMPVPIRTARASHSLALDRGVDNDILKRTPHEARGVHRCEAPRLGVDVALEVGRAAQLDYFDFLQVDRDATA